MSEENKDKKQELPSLFQMAKNFALELKKYVAEGAPNVSHVNYIRRLSACESCDALIKDKMRCGLCGCLIEHKAKWQTADCPAKPSKWPKEIIRRRNTSKNKQLVQKHIDDFKRKNNTKPGDTPSPTTEQSKGDS